MLRSGFYDLIGSGSGDCLEKIRPVTLNPSANNKWKISNSPKYIQTPTMRQKSIVHITLNHAINWKRCAGGSFQSGLYWSSIKALYEDINFILIIRIIIYKRFTSGFRSLSPVRLSNFDGQVIPKRCGFVWKPEHKGYILFSRLRLTEMMLGQLLNANVAFL